jgi:hypothetical protein
MSKQLIAMISPKDKSTDQIYKEAKQALNTFNKTEKKTKLMKRLRMAVIFVILLLLSGVLFFAISTISYQRLVNEGSILEDNQCLMVNPEIIKRRNSYIKLIQIMKTGGSKEEYQTEQQNYKDLSSTYVRVQEIWLKQQKKYLNRGDYLLFAPKEIKAAGMAQYTSREAQMKSIIAMLALYDTTDQKKQKELNQTIINERMKQDKADREFNQLWETKPSFDLRRRFINVPESTCPVENFDIPDTTDLFSPEVPIQSGPVS